jgi:hypothetical protein
MRNRIIMIIANIAFGLVVVGCSAKILLAVAEIFGYKYKETTCSESTTCRTPSTSLTRRPS